MKNNQKPNNRPTVAAIYCPLWHRYDHMDSWHGEGWNEWQLLKTAPRRFRGHYQPYRPTWGCFDESDPKWAAKEIALAADHGIDVFLFDWYWYSGVKLMEEALERGFLKAPNRKRLRFALMWANHDWADYFPAPYDREWNMWLPIRHSARDIHRVVDYCVEHYFRQPNYWRVDDGLFFSLFQPQVLIDQLGGVTKTRRIFNEVDRRLRRRGLPGMHWNAMAWSGEPVAKFKAAGFASTTSYNFASAAKERLPDDGIEQYADVMNTHREKWSALSRTALPYMPVVTMGWDVTPRCLHDVPWPFRPAPGQKQQKYPYGPVVVGNTPRRFGQLCRDARALAQNANPEHRTVFVNAWNEWTEGSFLLPEKRYGTKYLQAIRAAFGRAG